MSHTFEYSNWMENDTSTSAAFAALSYYLPTSDLLADSLKLDANINGSTSGTLNVSLAITNETATNGTTNQLINNHLVQGCFFVLYAAIFVIGIFGNVLVCYVVCRNGAMQTVTNMFITNLALSDVLLCVLAVPFTPLYTFLGRWIFGRFLCHMVSYAQGCSVYISTLTLTAIAMDRFFVIIYPFHPRMRVCTCLTIITSVWFISLMLTLPYGLYMSLNSYQESPNDYFCEEDWPSESSRKVYGSVTVVLQFVLPFLIISVCYILVSFKLNDRARAKPGCKTSKKEEADRERKKRTNRMLISMVGVFGISWLPLNSVNIFNDFYETKSDFYTLLFFFAHCIAMSSTCYNPFLYAWLNENFRKEFKQVLPCFRMAGYNNNAYNNSRVPRPERTFYRGNGDIEVGQESLLPANSTRTTEIIPREATYVEDTRSNCSILMRHGDLLHSPSGDAGIINLETVKPSTSPPTNVLSSGVLETPFDFVTSTDDINCIHITTNNNKMQNNAEC